ncbi:MAG TPA: hypothetical protein VMF66_05145 [Candidatus Acidoferrum sp.]|nr:hypothetical protein [Candidatus Acidoferrum sp.]
MATPNNRDPNQKQRDADLRDIEKVDVRRGWYGRGGSRLTWLWIWVIIIVVAFFWYAGWGWGGFGGWWGGRAHAVVTTGSGVAVLNSTNKIPYVGHHFDLRDARVQAAVTNTVFWVSNGRSQPMLLVVTTNAPVSAARITPGDLVATSGTVEKAPSAEQAEVDWHLNDSGAQQLEKDQAYLQTAYVAKLQRQANNSAVAQ